MRSWKIIYFVVFICPFVEQMFCTTSTIQSYVVHHRPALCTIVLFFVLLLLLLFWQIGPPRSNSDKSCIVITFPETITVLMHGRLMCIAFCLYICLLTPTVLKLWPLQPTRFILGRTDRWTDRTVFITLAADTGGKCKNLDWLHIRV